MKSPAKAVFLEKREEEKEITLLPNTIIARRQNKCSSPEPVYKFIRRNNEPFNDPVSVCLKRMISEDGDSLVLASVNGSEEDVVNYELKLWPCESDSGINFWQEQGIFANIED